MQENGTYIRNTDFPQALSGDDIDDCSFEINKCADGMFLQIEFLLNILPILKFLLHPDRLTVFSKYSLRIAY